MRNPYESPSAEEDLLERPPLSPEEAKSILRLPAVGLIATGVLGLMVVIGVATGGILVPPDEERALIHPTVDLVMMLGAALFVGVLQTVTIWGGREIAHLRNYRAARWCVVVAIASLGGAGCIGLPFAIWSLLLLRDQRIRDAFEAEEGANR